MTLTASQFPCVKSTWRKVGKHMKEKQKYASLCVTQSMRRLRLWRIVCLRAKKHPAHAGGVSISRLLVVIGSLPPRSPGGQPGLLHEAIKFTHRKVSLLSEQSISLNIGFVYGFLMSSISIGNPNLSIKVLDGFIPPWHIYPSNNLMCRL